MVWYHHSSFLLSFGMDERQTEKYLSSHTCMPVSNTYDMEGTVDRRSSQIVTFHVQLYRSRIDSCFFCTYGTSPSPRIEVRLLTRYLCYIGGGTRLAEYADTSLTRLRTCGLHVPFHAHTRSGPMTVYYRIKGAAFFLT